jgi:hypothetical protein
VIAIIKDAIDEVGSQTAFAKAAKVSNQYLNDIINQRRNIGEKVLEHIGLRRLVMYEKVNADKKARA